MSRDAYDFLLDLLSPVNRAMQSDGYMVSITPLGLSLLYGDLLNRNLPRGHYIHKRQDILVFPMMNIDGCCLLRGIVSFDDKIKIDVCWGFHEIARDWKEWTVEITDPIIDAMKECSLLKM